MTGHQQWTEVQIIMGNSLNSNLQTPNYNRNVNQNIQSAADSENSHTETNTLQILQCMENSCPLSEITCTSSDPKEDDAKNQQFCLLQEEYEQKKDKHSHLELLKKMPRTIVKDQKIKIWCKTQFPLVRAVATGEFGWKPLSRQVHKQNIDIIWSDSYITEELVNRLRPYQKINHFPYSSQLGRKDFLFANLNSINSQHPKQYDFYPKTWNLPNDLEALKKHDQMECSESQKFYIVKPTSSCQGKGIYLTKDIGCLSDSTDKVVVQQYLSKPLLIDGLKFDLRIYVLLKSMDPLEIYVYQEGLARFATMPYCEPNESNQGNVKMHLTNYSINKANPEFIQNKDFRKDNVGHKRSISSVYEQIRSMGGDVDSIRSKIDSIIVKTIIAARGKMLVSQAKVKPGTKNKNTRVSIVGKRMNLQSPQKHSNEQSANLKQRMPNGQGSTHQVPGDQTQRIKTEKCFQLLGFDIMLTEQYEPMLIEINHQSSLQTASPLDYIVKKYLLIDTFNLLDMNSEAKAKYKIEHASQNQQQSPQKIFMAKSAKQNPSTKQSNKTKHSNITTSSVKAGAYRKIYPLKQEDSLMKVYNEVLPCKSQSKKQKVWSKKKLDSLSPPSFDDFFSKFSRNSMRNPRKQYLCTYVNMFNNEIFVHEERQKYTKQHELQLTKQIDSPQAQTLQNHEHGTEKQLNQQSRTIGREHDSENMKGLSFTLYNSKHAFSTLKEKKVHSAIVQKISHPQRSKSVEPKLNIEIKAASRSFLHSPSSAKIGDCAVQSNRAGSFYHSRKIKKRAICQTPSSLDQRLRSDRTSKIEGSNEKMEKFDDKERLSIIESLYQKQLQGGVRKLCRVKRNLNEMVGEKQNQKIDNPNTLNSRNSFQDLKQEVLCVKNKSVGKDVRANQIQLINPETISSNKKMRNVNSKDKNEAGSFVIEAIPKDLSYFNQIYRRQR